MTVDSTPFSRSPETAAQDVVYCIGDSHVSFFAGDDVIQPAWPARSQDRLPWFRTFHIGPVLAFSLSRPGTQMRGREQLFGILAQAVPAGARVMLCFGEIDCRAHILKQVAKQGLPVEAVVGGCLDAYFQVVREIQALGFEVIVCNAVPTRLSTPRKPKRDDDYVAVGSWQARNAAVRLFNAGAAERCRACGAHFLGTYAGLVDGNDRTVEWFFFDAIHLSQRGMPLALQAMAEMFPAAGYPRPPLASPGWLQKVADRLAKRLRRLLRMAPGKRGQS